MTTARERQIQRFQEGQAAAELQHQRAYIIANLRYWTPTRGGSQIKFGWTTRAYLDRASEREGMYASVVLKPTGRGARTGDAESWKLDMSQTSWHKLRKDAKALALHKRRQDDA